jgi:hypothetical protein
VAVEWFYMRGGQIVGPLTTAQLRERALAQKVALVAAMAIGCQRRR